ncbi:MAG: glycosyltransferase [Planctomycetota bacterium]
MTPSVTVVLSASSLAEARALLEQWQALNYPEPSLAALLMAPAGIDLPQRARVHAAVRTGRHAADVNQALARADTDYLAFADATLELDPGWVEALVKEARGSWRVVGVASKMYARDRWIASVGAGLARGYRWVRSRLLRGGPRPVRRQPRGVPLTLNGSLLDRNHVRTGPGLDEDFTTTHAEIDLSLRIVAAGYRLRRAGRHLPAIGRSARSRSQPRSAELHRRVGASVPIARHYPDLLAEQVAVAAPVLAPHQAPDHSWSSCSTSGSPPPPIEARERCLGRLLADPVHLFEHLKDEWQRRAQGT